MAYHLGFNKEIKAPFVVIVVVVVHQSELLFYFGIITMYTINCRLLHVICKHLYHPFYEGSSNCLVDLCVIVSLEE